MDLLPKEASPQKVYRQAKKLLKNTSRASNADWYRNANQLALQWHIWVGSQSISSAIYNQTANEWFEGPELPPVAFEVGEDEVVIGLDEPSRNGLHDLIRRVLATKEFGLKAKSLGIIFHLADSIRVRDLEPEFAADEEFDDINELLTTAPEIALGDDSLNPEEGNWRLLPLVGVQEGDRRSLALQISGQYKFIVDELREYGELRNIPVITNVHAAPLEAMTAVTELFPERTFTNSLFLFQYESFTFLFATGPRQELLLVRPLVHRNSDHLSPSEISDLVGTTSALLNIKSPKLFYASMTGMEENQIDELLTSLKESVPGIENAVSNARGLSSLESVPGKRVEFLCAAISPETPEEDADTFTQLRGKWAFLDFYGLSNEEQLLMPTRADLRLLKFSGIFQKVALLSVIAFGGWTATDFFTKMRSDAWKLDDVRAQSMQESVELLKKERREWDHWAGLLAKRSEGWVALETLLSIFPESSGIILSNASYTAGSLNADDKESVGMQRSWKVSGYANPEIATQLSTLGSRTRVTGMLNEIADELNAPYLKVEGDTRQLQVSLAQRQGTMPSSRDFPTRVARHFRSAFELRIEQKMTHEDELAINTTALD
ncbi:MAG: hypothetical protein AAF733_00465 [Verrucomicrobiota bacterium]